MKSIASAADLRLAAVMADITFVLLVGIVLGRWCRKLPGGPGALAATGGALAVYIAQSTYDGRRGGCPAGPRTRRQRHMETTERFRVMLTLEVDPGLAAEFEQVWQDGAAVITGHPANLGHWLARSTATEHRYYIVSDWVDEKSFRAFESSGAHLEHRARLHPYRRTGAFDTMRVWSSAARAAQPARAEPVR